MATLLLTGHIGDQPYALPVSMVERVLPMAALTLLPGMPRGMAGVLNLHGTVLPAVDPRPQVGIPTPLWHPDQRLVLVCVSTRYLLWMDTVERIVRAPVQHVTSAAGETGLPMVSLLASFEGQTIPVLSPQALDPGPITERAGGATRL